MRALLAAGGTGGHMFPAQALSEVLVREGWVPDDLAVGDVLATPVTGAYGHSMGST